MIYQVVLFKNIRFKTLMLRSDLCDLCDAYIVVKGVMNIKTVANTNINKKRSCI